MATPNGDLIPVDVVFDSNLASDPDRGTFTISPSLNNVVGMNVQWVTVPYSYYNIDRLSNSMAVFWNYVSDEDNENDTLYLDPGTYNDTSLANEMSRAFSETQMVKGVDIRVFMSPHRARLVIYNLNMNSDEKFAIRINNEYLAKVLGFDANTTYPAVWKQVWRDGQMVNATNTDVNDNMWVIEAPYLLNLNYSSLINIYSTLAPTMQNSARRPDSIETLISQIPVNIPFTGIINYTTPGTMIPIDRTTVDRAEFYLRLQGRSNYAKNSRTYDNSDYTITDYLPLNGEGFQICVRFWCDNGRTVFTG